MPAEIVTMADCASCFGVFEIPSSDGKTKYSVQLSGETGGVYCTCPAFQYSPGMLYEKTCKHIALLWKPGNACLYNPQWRDGCERPKYRPVAYTYDAIIEGEKCPACGGPVVAVRRAV